MVIFLENFVWTTNLLILVIIIFNLFAITKCIWYLTYTNSLILMHHLLYFAFIWLGCLNWIVICCHLVRMSKWLYTLHKLCGLVRILFPCWWNLISRFRIVFHCWLGKPTIKKEDKGTQNERAKLNRLSNSFSQEISQYGQEPQLELKSINAKYGSVVV